MDDTSSERSAEGLRRKDHRLHRTANSKKPNGPWKIGIAAGAFVAVVSVAIVISLWPTNCTVGRYGQWSSDCKQVVATADAYATPDSPPGKIALAYERGTFRVYSGMRLDQYQRFFTDTPQTLFRVGAVSYVHDDVLMLKSQPVEILIGSHRFPMSLLGAGSWELDQASVKGVLAEAADEQQILVDYHSDIGVSRASFGTDGLAQAIQSLR